MASELRVNTLKDASGNNSVGMEYVADGTSKSWQRTTVTSGTPSVIESLNNTSVTDNGTGHYTYTFTSNMSSATYGAAGNVNEPFGVACINNATSFGASGYIVYIHNHANTDTDPNFVSNNMFGDLA